MITKDRHRQRNSHRVALTTLLRLPISQKERSDVGVLENVLNAPITQKRGDPKSVADGVFNVEKAAGHSSRKGGRTKGLEPRGNQHIDEFDNAAILDEGDENHVNHAIRGDK